jgi:protoporphyrinogen oxidase
VQRARTIILGGGMCGLGAALASYLPAYEATDRPGGVCYSYYVDPEGVRRDPPNQDVSGCFRFEPAGGHWMFGISPDSLTRIGKFAAFRKYKRQAAVYFPQSAQLVPFPLQDNLRYLDKPLRDRIVAEICYDPPAVNGESPSLKDWLFHNFGPTLCELFFFPFNERYTAGLYSGIAAQDGYKSALDRQRVLQGASGNTEDKGYNSVFYYPGDGLDHLIRNISAGCTVHLDHAVSGIDSRDHQVFFSNGTQLPYDRIISTIPLNHMVRLCEVECGAQPDPATAVLVVNVGAVRGHRDFLPYHWIYVPSSSSGMHRFGFYNHVDSSFLPLNYQNRTDIVSIYAERSFSSASPPGLKEQSSATSAIVEELKDWGVISEPIVISWTFTDPAYTWSRRGSTWAQHAINQLSEAGISQIGRYGGWRFQGMLESFEQGLSAGRSTTLEIARQM